MITNEQEIKESASITDVVTKYVHLNRNGKAKCPFHEDKTPSFSVKENLGVFKCFGCGIAGDSIKFLMEKEGCTYPEALEKLARISGIKVERKQLSPKEQEEYNNRMAERKAMYHHNKLIADYFCPTLDPALYPRVLVDGKRDLSYQTIHDFKIGYAPDKGLVEYAKKAGWNIKLLVRLGVIRELDQNKYASFFRDRLMFTLHNAAGEIIGFDGRLLSQKDLAKYLNSKESEIFKKRNQLYGLLQNRKTIRKEGTAILVEGRMDVVTAYDHNIKLLLGTGGTSITAFQAKTIGKYAKNCILVMDGDTAGQNAAKKALPLLIEAGLSVGVVSLPKKHDPDSYIREFGAKSFLQVVGLHPDDAKTTSQMVEGIEWAVLNVLGDGTHFKKEAAITLAIELLGHMREGAKQASLIAKIKNLLKCPIGVLKDGIKKADNEKNTPKLTPKQLDDRNFYGVFEDNFSYYAAIGSEGGQQVSNFIINPLYLLRDREKSKRLVEVKNNRGDTFVADIESDAFVELPTFKKVVENQGNFLFFGRNEHYIRIKRKVYAEMPPAQLVTVFGQHTKGFYAWGNGVLYKDNFIESNKYGIVDVAGARYFIDTSGAQSEENSDPDIVEIGRRFKYKENKKIDFRTWSRAFHLVFGDNGLLAICYVIAALYRDMIFTRFHFFPHINLFGPPQSGKSYLARAVMSLFGVPMLPFMLHQGTNVAFARRLSQVRNGIIWADEYKNNIKPRRIEALKNAYDGSVHEKGKVTSDNKTTSTPVRSGLIISGQELPTADVALYTRCINLQFGTTKRTEKEMKVAKELEQMTKGGLTSVIAEILKYREVIEENFDITFDKTLSRFKQMIGKEQVDTRIILNTVIVVTFHDVLCNHLVFPVLGEFIDQFAVTNTLRQSRVLTASSEVSTFWDIVVYLWRDRKIFVNDDFIIRDVEEIKVLIDGKPSIKKMQGGIDKVLFLSLSRIHPLYMKSHFDINKSQGMSKSSLEHYLRVHQSFLGYIKSYRIGKRNTSCLAFRYADIGVELHEIEEISQGAI